MIFLAMVVLGSLCSKTEHTYFSCALKNGKQIALCGVKSKSLQYRFGTASKIELAFPADKDPKAFRWERHIHVNSMSFNVLFENAGYGYDLYDQDTMGSAYASGAGVLVSKDGKDISSLSCVEKGKVLDVEALAEWIAHGPDDQEEPK